MYPRHRCRGTDPLTTKPRYIRKTLKTYGAAGVALTMTWKLPDGNSRMCPGGR